MHFFLTANLFKRAMVQERQQIDSSLILFIHTIFEWICGNHSFGKTALKMIKPWRESTAEYNQLNKGIQFSKISHTAPGH